MAYARRKFHELWAKHGSEVGEQALKNQWLRQQRQRMPDGSATARAIDYSLKRWAALTRYLDDGDLPVDNNWVGNRIRPIALGRQNWLFAALACWQAGRRRHELDPVCEAQ